MKTPVVLCLLLTLLLAACALSPKDFGQSYMFSLSPAKAAGKIHSGRRLTVELPVTAPELDTYRISLIRDKGIRDYYAGARWADFLPVLVQDSLLRTLETSGSFGAVAGSQAGVAGDMVLKVEIRDFQASYGPHTQAPAVHICLVFSLLNRKDGSISAPVSIGPVVRQATDDSLPAIHAAFRSAFLSVERQIVGNLGQTLAPKQP